MWSDGDERRGRTKKRETRQVMELVGSAVLTYQPHGATESTVESNVQERWTILSSLATFALEPLKIVKISLQFPYAPLTLLAFLRALDTNRPGTPRS